jgi:protein tyrosine/serine phosphatase
LKKVIVLNNETSVMNKFQTFIKFNNITLVKFDNINTEIGSEPHNDWMVFPQNIIQEVIEVLLDKQNYNLLIIDKTNVIIGLVRKICKWSYSSIISEYRLYSGKNANYFAETFLELTTIHIKSRYLEAIEHSRSQSEDAAMDRRFSEDIDLAAGDDDDNEENILSASPQVPKTLLKMAELRKQKNRAHEDQSILDLYSLAKTGETQFYQPAPEFQQIEVIKINLPQENLLPEWFKLQRDLWVQEQNLLTVK